MTNSTQTSLDFSAPRQVAAPRFHQRSVREYAILFSRLKRAEAKFRAESGKFQGGNSLWNDWSERPRSGARWTSEELIAVETMLEQMTQHTFAPLNEVHLCHIAWRHGRSANAVREKLAEHLGFKRYYSIFEATL